MAKQSLERADRVGQVLGFESPRAYHMISMDLNTFSQRCF
jgi:hypothetical protein